MLLGAGALPLLLLLAWQADGAGPRAQPGARGHIHAGPARLAPGLAVFAPPPVTRSSLRLRGGSPDSEVSAADHELNAGWNPQIAATKEAQEAWAETRCCALLLVANLPAPLRARQQLRPRCCQRFPAGLLTVAWPAERGGSRSRRRSRKWTLTCATRRKTFSTG